MTHRYLTFFTSLLIIILTLTDTKTLAQTATPFYYDRFDTNAFQLVGQTTTSRDRIRLTPAQGSKKGAIWDSTKQVVSKQFTVTYKLQTKYQDTRTRGADGLAFVIQNEKINAIGYDGGSMGINITNSVAWPWDTYYNVEYGDHNRFHLCLLTRGTLINNPNHTNAIFTSGSLASAPDTNIHLIRLTYNYGKIKIYFEDTTQALGTTYLNLNTELNLDSGRAWVGFTAATGGIGWQTHDILFWSFDTLIRPLHEPVIIIGGIMTSPLYDSEDSILLATEKIWADKNRLLVQRDDFLQVLELASDGINPAQSNYQIKFPPLATTPQIPTLQNELARLPLSTYQPLVQELTLREKYVLDNGDSDHGEMEDLFIFTYDWRKSAQVNAQQLNLLVDSVSKWTNYNQVKIVAHSFGGLVAKSYVSQFGTEKLSRIVFIGVPNLGAPKMTYVLLSGDLMGLLGLAVNHEMIKNLSRNFPSAYELLPSYTWFNFSGNGQTLNSNLYGQYLIAPQQTLNNYSATMNYLVGRQLNGAPEFNSALINSAIANQNYWANVNFDATEIYNVVGCNLPTPGSIMITSETTVPIFNLNGDGTVPLGSAEGINGNSRATIYLSGVKHNDLCANETAIKTITKLLRKVADTVTTGYPLASTVPPTSYGINTTATRVGSPVLLHAYDAENNHTGPINDTAWEAQIPGSSFVSGPLNDPEASKIILLPVGQSYRTTITNLLDTVSNFDLWSQNNSSNNAPQITIFNNLTLENGSSAARSDINQTANDLEIDQNGDSNYETIITPITNFSKLLDSGWNLVALPLKTKNDSLLSIFPSILPYGFRFNGQYVSSEQLDSTSGWWIKIKNDNAIDLIGQNFALDTINLISDWNLIGIGSKSKIATELNTLPNDLLNSQFFKYQNGYSPTDTLYPGFGYWIKAKQAGQIILR